MRENGDATQLMPRDRSWGAWTTYHIYVCGEILLSEHGSYDFMWEFEGMRSMEKDAVFGEFPPYS